MRPEECAVAEIGDLKLGSFFYYWAEDAQVYVLSVVLQHWVLTSKCKVIDPRYQPNYFTPMQNDKVMALYLNEEQVKENNGE